MRVLVCGGRDFYEPSTVDAALDSLEGVSLIIEGGQSGADNYAAEWAKKNDIPLNTYPADWKAYGRAAGPIRNRLMLTEGKPDLIFAFPGGRGTGNMVKQAMKAGIEVRRCGW